MFCSVKCTAPTPARRDIIIIILKIIIKNNYSFLVVV